MPAAIHAGDNYSDLIQAAHEGRLSRLAHLSSPIPGLSGLVVDLGEYVLAWAAEAPSEHVTARLEAARGAV
ncbi:MAG: hypothetical protein ACR2J4_08755 [Deinococcus sp.]